MAPTTNNKPCAQHTETSGGQPGAHQQDRHITLPFTERIPDTPHTTTEKCRGGCGPGSWSGRGPGGIGRQECQGRAGGKGGAGRAAGHWAGSVGSQTRAGSRNGSGLHGLPERALEQTLWAPGTERALERTLLAPGTERALSGLFWLPERSGLWGGLCELPEWSGFWGELCGSRKEWVSEDRRRKERARGGLWGSRNGAGSRADSVGSRNGAGSRRTVGSRIGADSVG